MPGGFAITADVQEAIRRMSSMEQSMSGEGLRAAGEYVSMQIFESSQQSFVRQADPTTGAAWKPSHRAEKQGGETLLDTGRLRRTVRAAFRMLSDGKVEAYGGTTPLPYAAIHQFGGTITQGMRVGRHLLSVGSEKDRLFRGRFGGLFGGPLGGKTSSKFISRRQAAKEGVYRMRQYFAGMRTIHIPARPYVGLEPNRYERIRVFIRSMQGKSL